MSDADEGTRTRLLLIVGGAVVALAVLVGFVIVPLLAGDGDEVADTDVVVVDAEPEATPPADDTTDLPDPEELAGDPAPETFEVFNARDPFHQLVDDEEGAGSGQPPNLPPGSPPPPGSTPPPGTTPGTQPPPDSSDGGDPTDGTDGTNGTGDGTGTDASDGDGNGSDAQVGGTTVTLVDVFDDEGERQATVTVNGTGYTVGEGETFGRRFRLLDISGRCATMLFGDSRFTLCEGERIRK